jgi:molybdopterin/thiamine biosynthesis adenylyltransferase
MQNRVINEYEIESQFGRVKGASWFPSLYKRDVMILGQGGIGSWLSLLLARAGCNLHTFDMDTFEAHNMTGQFVTDGHIGTNKAKAVADMVGQFSPCTSINTYGEYTLQSVTNDIVVCGFDNMRARKIAFEKWRALRSEVMQGDFDGEFSLKDMFFQDGRLLAEQLQILNIPGDRDDLVEQYEEEYLFEDSEVEEADCTFKQTSHVAAIIAGMMVGFLTNWAINVEKGKIARQVPFFHQYIVPLNMQT